MNYQKHYSLLIQKAQNRSTPNCYIECHHILPKALGGSDDSFNLVHLTAREHFIAHLLLAKIHGGKMWFAVNMMAKRCAGHSNSRIFATIKENQPNYKGNILATRICDGKEFELHGKKDMKRLGLVSSHIYACLSGKAKSHKGFTYNWIPLNSHSYITVFDFL